MTRIPATAEQLRHLAEHDEITLVLPMEPQPKRTAYDADGGRAYDYDEMWCWASELPGLLASDSPHAEGDVIELEDEHRWSCFTCGYLGTESGDTDDGDCPECGTISGDGFGMWQNDPRYEPIRLTVTSVEAKQILSAVTAEPIWVWLIRARK